VCAPVRWEESMHYAVAQGCEALLEVGPGTILSAMMRRIAPQVQVLTLDDMLRH
jgi:[acyl-carrier-protein] S-malonyltransferase